MQVHEIAAKLPDSVKRALRPIAYAFGRRKKPWDYELLKNSMGVIHIGANEGGEAGRYASYGLAVLWFEPIPDVYGTLVKNLKTYPNQTAINGLVTDKDGETYSFNIASNNGASSSILDFADHSKINGWESVHYTHSLDIKGFTLPTHLKRAGVGASDFDALVMDTQGSELLILQGALPIIRNFKHIVTEVPDFNAYQGCPQLDEIKAFLRRNGFKESSRRKFASEGGVGAYYDVLFRRIK